MKYTDPEECAAAGEHLATGGACVACGFLEVISDKDLMDAFAAMRVIEDVNITKMTLHGRRTRCVAGKDCDGWTVDEATYEIQVCQGCVNANGLWDLKDAHVAKLPEAKLAQAKAVAKDLNEGWLVSADRKLKPLGVSLEASAVSFHDSVDVAITAKTGEVIWRGPALQAHTFAKGLLAGLGYLNHGKK